MVFALILTWLSIGLIATTTDVLRRLVNVAWQHAAPGCEWPTLRFLLRYHRPTPEQRCVLVGNVLGGPVTAFGLWLPPPAGQMTAVYAQEAHV
jgi:hypothetical protein